MSQEFTASKTRTNRPGWSVIFKHPRRTDSRNKPGLKVRRGLGTTDDGQADRLVDQLNELLRDETWWSVDRRADAERKFDSVVVSAFFDGLEAGKRSAADLRSSVIPMPRREDGYARVMLVGTTGAGKTTLLRHFIGSDHEKDRFPSTSTARTTTADTEIITAEGPFEAVITFMPEHEVRAHIDECLEDACLNAIQGQGDSKIAGALLSHREQRFRLSYVLGAWQQEDVPADAEFSFEHQGPSASTLDEGEVLTPEQRSRNSERLEDYVARIKDVAERVGRRLEESVGALKDFENPDDRAGWLEIFTDTIFEDEAFAQLTLDIKDDIEERFSFIQTGTFEYAATGWPILWSLEQEDRDAFLKEVRWFSSNHHKQFGRLLTPLVDGMRVKGPFWPSTKQLDVAEKLVLLDGQGIGHTAKSAASISTSVTRRFSEVDLILLVDNAEQPMQAAPLELLRSVGSSGNANKLAVAFTHFDLVKGDNLGSFQQKRDHVMDSVANAMTSLKQPLGAPVAGMLERQIEQNAFFLGGLDRATAAIPGGFRTQMADLLRRMQAAAEPLEPVAAVPIYVLQGLEIALRDAVEGFQRPWKAKLGFKYHDGIAKEHWTRVKALTRRFANAWTNEYDDLRPVADLVARMQENISRWLENPAGWERTPETDEEREASLAGIRKAVFNALHDLAEKRLAELHKADWLSAYQYVGSGSGARRANEIDRIYGEAAPAISSAMSATARSFLNTLHEIVRNAVVEGGGKITAQIEPLAKRATA